MSEKKFIFNAFINLEPLQRSYDGCDMRKFELHHSTCKAVLNLLERFLGLLRMFYSELQYSSSEWTLVAAIVLAVFMALIMAVTNVHNDLVLSTDVG